MYNYKIKTSFIAPEMPRARVKKTGFSLMIFIFIENWI